VVVAQKAIGLPAEMYGRGLREYKHLENTGFANIRAHYYDDPNDVFIHDLAVAVDYDVRHPLSACQTVTLMSSPLLLFGPEGAAVVSGGSKLVEKVVFYAGGASFAFGLACDWF
jgi:hypothetical protein